MLRATVLASAAFALAIPGLPQTRPEVLSVAQAKIMGVTLPACAYCPAPEYTSRARRAKIQGTVGMEAVVTVDGRAQRISVIKGLDTGLDKKAVEAIKKWRFTPAHDADGRPVAISVPVDLTFSLI